VLLPQLPFRPYLLDKFALGLGWLAFFGRGRKRPNMLASRRKLPFTFRFQFGFCFIFFANSGLGVSGPVQPDPSCDLLESRPTDQQTSSKEVGTLGTCFLSCISFGFFWASAGCWPGQKNRTLGPSRVE